MYVCHSGLTWDKCIFYKNVDLILTKFFSVLNYYAKKTFFKNSLKFRKIHGYDNRFNDGFWRCTTKSIEDKK